jgi:hypothetical protein
VFSVDPTSDGACTVAGDGTVALVHAGSCVIDADQVGTADYTAAPTVTQTVAVAPAATVTSVAVAPTALTAKVAAVNPAAGAVTGTVQFSLDGVVVGTAPLDPSGVATLHYTVPAGGSRHVAAVYTGSADFTGSAASTSRTDPTIVATLTSARPKTPQGWYTAAVTIRFACSAGTGALAVPCPSPVTLAGTGAGQSLSRAVTTTDGGVAVVTADGINIDLTAPAVRVTGVRNGAVYRGTAPKPACAAVDAVSGVTRCVVRTAARRDGITRYTLTATNGAGLSTRLRGSYRVLDVWLQQARWRKGVYNLRAGRTITILVSSRTLPRYDWAAPARAAHRATTPRGGDTAFYPHGPGRWELRVTLAPRMTRRYSEWNLGVRVGKSLRVVRVALKR